MCVCVCHGVTVSRVHVSDVEARPDLADGAGGPSVPQQKAQQIVGGRCLLCWLRLLAHHAWRASRGGVEYQGLF